MFENMSNNQIITEHHVEYADWQDERASGETELGFVAWLEARS